MSLCIEPSQGCPPPGGWGSKFRRRCRAWRGRTPSWIRQLALNPELWIKKQTCACKHVYLAAEIWFASQASLTMNHKSYLNRKLWKRMWEQSWRRHFLVTGLILDIFNWSLTAMRGLKITQYLFASTFTVKAVSSTDSRQWTRDKKTSKIESHPAPCCWRTSRASRMVEPVSTYEHVVWLLFYLQNIWWKVKVFKTHSPCHQQECNQTQRHLPISGEN